MLGEARGGGLLNCLVPVRKQEERFTRTPRVFLRDSSLHPANNNNKNAGDPISHVNAGKVTGMASGDMLFLFPSGMQALELLVTHNSGKQVRYEASGLDSPGR